MTRDEISNFPAGIQMRYLVATDVMGWKLETEYFGSGVYGFWRDPITKKSKGVNAWRPDENILDAWLVVTWCKENGWSLELVEHADPEGDYIITFWRRDMTALGFTARADTAPLAICRAVLLAVMEDEG